MGALGNIALRCKDSLLHIVDHWPHGALDKALASAILPGKV